MKNSKKVLPLSLALAMSVSTVAFANEGLDAILLEGTDTEITMTEGVEDLQDHVSRFEKLVGTVTEIRTLEDGTVFSIIIDRGEEKGGLADLQISENTVLLNDEVEVGDTLTAYITPSMIMTMIFPQQFNTAVLVNATEEPIFVTVDGFMLNEETGELEALDNLLRVNVGEDTEITDHLGEAFDFDIDLNGRNLVVIYSMSTRSLPPLTTPERIMVLPVTGMMPELPVLDENPELPVSSGDLEFAFDPSVVNAEIIDTPLADINLDDLVGMMPTFPVIDWSVYPIIVNFNGLTEEFVEQDGTVFVPLRPIIEVLGYRLDWNPETAGMDIFTEDSVISVYLDSNEVVRDGEIIIMDFPATLLGVTTHVPLSFFRDVLEFNNAYFEGGHVQINNEEMMQ